MTASFSFAVSMNSWGTPWGDQGVRMVRPDKFAVLAFELLIGDVPPHSQNFVRIRLINAVCGADTTKRRVAQPEYLGHALKILVFLGMVDIIGLGDEKQQFKSSSSTAGLPLNISASCRA